VNELIPLLNVEDVSRSIAFYETVLGATVESQWELDGRVRWARVTFDGGKLMLNSPDSVSSAERLRRAECTDAVLYLGCEDASAQRERLRAADIEVGELHEEEYGNSEFSLRDPDGYAIRFSSPRT
jgi:uncharacterized glyoxalase superfamily protein PhnB